MAVDIYVLAFELCLMVAPIRWLVGSCGLASCVLLFNPVCFAYSWRIIHQNLFKWDQHFDVKATAEIRILQDAASQKRQCLHLTPHCEQCCAMQRMYINIAKSFLAWVKSFRNSSKPVRKFSIINRNKNNKDSILVFRGFSSTSFCSGFELKGYTTSYDGIDYGTNKSWYVWWKVWKRIYRQ